MTSSERNKKRRWRLEGGQALVEFALAMPILFILIFALIDFGFGMKTHIAVTNASREAARFGAVGFGAGTYPDDCNSDPTDDATVVARACSALGSDVTNVQNVSVSLVERNGFPDIQNGDSIVVSITYKYDFITPLGPMMSTFTGGGLPSSVDLTSTTDMRLE